MLLDLLQAFDSARKIRCTLRPQGARRINEKVVSYAFNVDTLDQKEVTFETDEDVSKANAVLDIQVWAIHSLGGGGGWKRLCSVPPEKLHEEWTGQWIGFSAQYPDMCGGY